jgi:hypothetical protein
MIKVFTLGGLGNQMFQYAAAKALAERLNTGVCIDTSPLHVRLRNTTSRPYELNHFVLSKGQEQVVFSQVRGFLFFKIYPKVKKSFLGKMIAKNYALFEEENAYMFDSEILSLPDNSLLLGYFQAEKYFSSSEKIIREAFRFKQALAGKNLELAKKMKSCNSVSIHIRRGDYLSNKSSFETFCSIAADYYQKAIEHIYTRLENPVFFIFSDEPEKAKKEIPLPQANFIDWNKGTDSYIDMQLMTCCRHNIIANSSFSWWGAWLNPHPNKMVVAPAEWLKDKAANASIKDLLPGKWIRL